MYVRAAFGDFAGFLAAYSYWITTWVSNAALAVAAVGYLAVLFPAIGAHKWSMCLAALAVQWLPALANLAGTRYVGAVQLVATVLKLVPLLLVSVGGLFFFDPANLGPFQATGQSPVGAVSASAAILLFSYLGVESAAVSAGEVRDPARNVGRATILGTTGAAVVYLLGTLSVFGLVAHEKLVDSQAPFTDAVNAMFGGTWGGTLVACAAVISMVGALNGWTLLSAQTPYAAARDGLFPKVFTTKRRGVPVVGVLVTAVLASGLTVYNYTAGAEGVFEILVLVTTFTATVPYLLSTAAQLYFLASGRSAEVHRGRLVRDTVLAGLAFAFSMWLVSRLRLRGRLPGRALPLRGRPVLRPDGGPQAARGGLTRGDGRAPGKPGARGGVVRPDWAHHTPNREGRPHPCRQPPPSPPPRSPNCSSGSPPSGPCSCGAPPASASPPSYGSSPSHWAWSASACSERSSPPRT